PSLFYPISLHDALPICLFFHLNSLTKTNYFQKIRLHIKEEFRRNEYHDLMLALLQTTSFCSFVSKYMSCLLVIFLKYTNPSKKCYNVITLTKSVLFIFL